VKEQRKKNVPQSALDCQGRCITFIPPSSQLNMGLSRTMQRGIRRLLPLLLVMLLGLSMGMMGSSGVEARRALRRAHIASSRASTLEPVLMEVGADTNNATAPAQTNTATAAAATTTTSSTTAASSNTTTSAAAPSSTTTTATTATNSTKPAATAAPTTTVQQAVATATNTTKPAATNTTSTATTTVNSGSQNATKPAAPAATTNATATATATATNTTKPAAEAVKNATATATPTPATPVNANATVVANSTASANVTSTPQQPAVIKESRFDPAARTRRDQPRKVVGKAQKGEVSVTSYLATFSFKAGQSSDGYTVASYPQKSLEELAESCYKHDRCTGFTSTGELKSFIRPAAHWKPLSLNNSNSVNKDVATAGLYYQPQWYRFEPVPCPCGAEVALNLICSDPVSGDQYLGDPLTDQSCYKAKPTLKKHTCSPSQCVKLEWKVEEFGACPTCGSNVTVTRKVVCTESGEGKSKAVYSDTLCSYLSKKPETKKVCESDVDCAWSAVDGPCKVGCGNGFLDVNITCTSPVDGSVVEESMCSASTKPSNVKRCKSVDCVWNTVPDGKCSYSCGPGFRQLKATCIAPGKPDVVYPDKQCAGVAKPSLLIKCNNRECQWDSQPTSPCSQPCGRGTQSVRNTCRDPLTRSVMPPKQCLTEPPSTHQPCSVRSCVWETTPYKGCSTTCGKGVQYFNVTCRDPATSHRVDEKQCSSIPPPAPEAPCENNACGWRVKPVGKCSASCGDGYQQVKVTCEDPITGAILPESQCGSNKPNATQPCHVRECHWHREAKGSCSAVCGPGIQAFKLSCRDPVSFKKMKKRQCLNVPVPPLSEPCERHACEWRTAHKGKCSAICGPGRQKRKVSCHDPVTGSRVSDEQCTSKAPSRSTKCYAQACVWRMNPITSCSKSCGPAVQQVNVTCTDPSHKVIMPDRQCFDASKPNTTQSCNLQDCSWSSTPASACSTTCGKGQQKLAVVCKDPLTGKVQEDGQCDVKKKPASEASCFLKPCSWVTEVPPGKCSQICGPGHVEAKVTCQDAQAGLVYDDTLCPESPKPSNLRPCQLAPCQWRANWTECGVKCGGDIQYATLECTHPKDGTVVSNAQCRAAPPAWRQCNTEPCTDIPEAFLLYTFQEKIAPHTTATRLKNRVTEAAKYGLDGLVQGAGASRTEGRGGRGSALALSASSDHTKGPSVVIPAGKELTSPSFTISMWLKLMSQPTAGRFYILLDNRGTRGGGEGFVLYLDPRDGLVYLNDAYSAKVGKSHFADSGEALPNDGDFHHLAVTYNQKLVKFFIDGKQTSSVDPSHTFQFTVNISQHNVYVRGSPDAYWRVLPMAIDQFAYFDYALTNPQAHALAQPNPEAKRVCGGKKLLTGGGCAEPVFKGDLLDKHCANSPSPFSVEKCLQPLWGLNGCSSLSTSYPSIADANLWNNKTWLDIKKTVHLFAAKDRKPESVAGRLWGVCQNRSPSKLDLVCDHPPPYHTNICLQALWLETGCSRKGTGWPASRSHPLTQQLNQLSWRDVKAKVKKIAAGDMKGGQSQGVCHGPMETDFDQL